MRVTEIFQSIQGETSQAGRPCAFVRFTGCDLRCSYCDTAYAYHGGEEISRAEVVGRLSRFATRFVTLTGGEPLLQPELPELCGDLLARGWEVAVETHGQRPIRDLPAGVRRIVDVKTPGSGVACQSQQSLSELRPGDEVKFVLCSEEDFRWAVEIIRSSNLEQRAVVLLSPVLGRVEPKDLVTWMLEARLQARLNLQLHKVIWGAEARGV
jgi:7-carboxy-7-deazaguanine synthase